MTRSYCSTVSCRLSLNRFRSTYAASTKYHSHKERNDTSPFGISWLQTLQTADSDTYSGKHSNYYCSNSSITNALILFVSNMVIQITRHFAEEKNTSREYRSCPACSLISTPSLLPQFSVVNYVQFAILTWSIQNKVFWLSALYIKYHKFIKSQDNWKTFQTIMPEMHTKMYACLHVLLSLLLLVLW